ncbi:hypothetical protein C922_00295 [Plasmodium inui San Antonio 1]|uniref:AP2/ERF domain-containing protein n=1 Tax=Plasmodium inui San Antonio 1 TaxID=1237626 RepID=W7A895_9APIC|nr:hypothetical protein C922_00295 [Plasmodium inui San Antonio 1]EUD69432.1 hypothetical protein C922_00295 [Plasmodium inui San Antonio 1]
MINSDENADAAGTQKESPPNSAVKNPVNDKGTDEKKSEEYDANEDNTKNKGVWYNARTKCWLACVKGSGRHLRVFSVKKHGFKKARMLAVECKNSALINFNQLPNGTAKREANGAANREANGSSNGASNGEANGAPNQNDSHPSSNGNDAEITLVQRNGVYAKLKNETNNHVSGRTRTYTYNEAGRTNHTKLEAQESIDVGSLVTMNSENASGVTNASISASASANGAEEGPSRKRRYNTRKVKNKSVEELNKKEEKNEIKEEDASFYKGSNNSSVTPPTSRAYNARGHYNTKGNLKLKGGTITKGRNYNNIKRNSSSSKGSGGSSKGGSNSLRGVTISKVSKAKTNMRKGAGSNSISKGKQSNGQSLHNTETSSYNLTNRGSRNYPATAERYSSNSLTRDEVKSYKADRNKSVQPQNGKRRSNTLVETLDSHQGDNRKKKKTTEDKFSYLVRKDKGDGDGGGTGGDPAAISASAYHESSSRHDHNRPSSHATHSIHNPHNTHNTQKTRNTRNSSVHAVQFAQKGQNGQGDQNSHDDFQHVHSLNARPGTTQNYQHGTPNEGYNNGYDSSYRSAYHSAQPNQQNTPSGRTQHNTRSSQDTRLKNSTCIITDKDFQFDSPEKTNENSYLIKPINYDYSDNNVCKQPNNQPTNNETEYDFVFSNDCYSDYCSQNPDEYKANFIDLTREALSLILQDLKKNVIPKIPVGIEKRERYTNSLRLCLKSAKFTKHINELEPYLELFSECIKNSKLPSHMALKDQLFYLDKL